MSRKHDPRDPCARATGGNYDDHARNMHSAARQAHNEWLASMSPKERQRLASMHLDLPQEDDSEVGGHSPYSLRDIAETHLARTDTDYALEIDKPEEILADEFGIPATAAIKILAWHQREVISAVEKEKADYLQIIVGGLLSAKNPKLNSAGLAFASNLAALNGLPCQREYARQIHVSPSAISKVVRAWSRVLGLRPSAHQKSEEACQKYARIGKAKHWRGQAFTAGMATRLLHRISPGAPPACN
jgi:hypothetical protein